MAFRTLIPLIAAAITFCVVAVSVVSCRTKPAPLIEEPPAEVGSESRGKSDPHITQALIPAGQHGRSKMRKMVPRFITIHSTQNFSSGANAETHARLLQRGGLTSKHNSLGYLTWHFTVDDHSIYQTLPTSEQGQHADYEGPGNRSSIGIEMCENSGNSREQTVDRTARLAALLMRKHDIPISHVVPHQHWPRIRYSDQLDVGQKNCPHFLMDDGKPGGKWRRFLDKVRSYR